MSLVRYFVEIAYRGSRYIGWQRQSEGRSVQGTVEDVFREFLQDPDLYIVGCGRTDAGVHASSYFFHIDVSNPLSDRHWLSFERMLPRDIVCLGIYRPEPESLHARFDASRRSYRYDFHLGKNPFREGISTRLQRPEALDHEMIEAAARLILRQEEFAPFCKTGADNTHYRCQIMASRWEFGQDRWSYQISANRFLRGMVRLIVGMCLQVGEGKMSLSEVEESMNTQSALKRPWSVPAEGLYLTEIQYPEGALQPIYKTG